MDREYSLLSPNQLEMWAKYCRGTPNWSTDLSR